MNKKVMIASLVSVAAAVTVTAGIVALVVSVLNYNSSPTTDIWAEDDDEDEEETETSFYRDNPDPTPQSTRETQGRDYYEGGGYNGMDSYYIVQDLSVDEIIAEYEYYHDIAHTYELDDLKYFDQELKHPCYSQVDSTGYGLYMFYDLILPDEMVDHIASFNIEGNEKNGSVEFSMKIRIHDPDKANELYNSFVDRYSEGAQGSEYYNMLNTYDKGVKIAVSDTETRIVCFNRLKFEGYDYYIIYVSEDY